MSEKPNLSARETVILDNDTIDELDDLSLTGMIRGFESSNNPGEPAAAEPEIEDKTADGKDDDVFELKLMDD